MPGCPAALKTFLNIPGTSFFNLLNGFHVRSSLPFQHSHETWISYSPILMRMSCGQLINGNILSRYCTYFSGLPDISPVDRRTKYRRIGWSCTVSFRAPCRSSTKNTRSDSLSVMCLGSIDLTFKFWPRVRWMYHDIFFKWKLADTTFVFAISMRCTYITTSSLLSSTLLCINFSSLWSLLICTIFLRFSSLFRLHKRVLLWERVAPSTFWIKNPQSHS